MKRLLLCCAAFGLVTTGEAKVVEQTVEYRDGEVTCRGFLVYDDNLPGPRPATMVIHDWTGLGDFVRDYCRRLAALGYVALAADYYGQGTTAASPQEAGKLAGAVRGTPAMRTRGSAALAVLQQHPRVDRTKVVALGFCFGGTAALQLSYTGAELAGVVSLHGGLTPPEAGDVGKLRARYLILHGADDPHVPPAQVQTFEEALRAAQVDWQLIAYGGAVHAFTNPAAGHDPSRGAAYHEGAAKRSWEHLKLFLAEVCG
ncbi:MAG: dienelactone hydrolase family protein [Fimbriimonadaceae bacterium]|nr:dienelactone hydrolase family protein [Fimbriimonadaceae bacterium]